MRLVENVDVDLARNTPCSAPAQPTRSQMANGTGEDASNANGTRGKRVPLSLLLLQVSEPGSSCTANYAALQ
jgi:hypothetical protein